MLRILLAAVFLSVISGCSLNTEISDEDINRPLVVGAPETKDKTAESYVRLVMPEERLSARRISVNAGSRTLMDILSDAIPNVTVVPKDANVDLHREVSIYANNVATRDFLEQLSGRTDYQFKMKGRVLYVSSVETRRWNVAALVSRREGRSTVGQTAMASGDTTGDAEGANTISVSYDGASDWEKLVEGAESILGIDAASEGATADSAGTEAAAGGSTSTETKDEFRPHVVALRGMGELMASGPPSRMRVLDEWVTNLVASANKQVRLDIKAFDVTLKNRKGRGIDWNLLYGDLGDDGIAASGLSPVDVLDSGVWSLAANATRDKWAFESIFRFLETFGEVSVLNQPSLTTTNGSTAFLSSGDMTRFVAEVSQVQDAQGNVSVAPTLEEIKIGLSMAVTARVLDEDRILVEVVPVISSLQGFSEFSVAGFNFKTPNVALQELSTQVITRNGQTVHLGGLITRKLSEQFSQIPWQDKDGGFFNFLFSSVENELQRRELVITVTPTLVEV